MNREWLLPAKILTGICVLAVSSFSQTYTVSAKPGALNYVQGEVTVNGDPVWRSNLKSTFLNANDVLAVKNGRAEVLLNPGVFLRVGENSEVRMVKPSLIETQLEVVSGESMVEVDDLVPGSSIAVIDHGSSTTLLKPGLFRFTDHSIAALEGKADVAFGDRKVEVKKDKEVEIGDALKPSKVDLKQPDDLYAWSNTRSQYNAAASYAGATQAYQAGGYGFSSYAGPGWYWNSPFDSYMWMPGNGAFYSPFGWGFYGPGVVAYAPVIYLNNYGGYGGVPVVTKGTTTTTPGSTTTVVAHPPLQNSSPRMVVPVNPQHVGVASFQGSSPAQFAAARVQMQQAASYWGLHTANGSPAAVLAGGHTYANMQSASQAASSSARASGYSGASASGASRGGFSGSSGATARSAGGGGFSGGAAAHSAGASGGGHSK